MLLLLVACGDPKSNTTGLPPTPPPPDKPADGGLDPIPSPGDSRLPTEYLNRSVPLNPTSVTNFDPFREIFSDYFIGPPIGNIPLTLKLKLQNQFARSEFFLGIEDALGFSWAIVPYFQGTGMLSSTSFEMIFADDSVAIRIVALRVGDSLSGTVLFNTNHSCHQVITVCDTIFPGGFAPNDYCPFSGFTDGVSQCQASMSSQNATVLGTFSQAKLSTWVW